MRRLWILVLLLSSVLLFAEEVEPDLSGQWSRANGAILEAKRDVLDGTWAFRLVKAAPGSQGQATVGNSVVTGLKWTRSGPEWKGGKVRVTLKKKVSEYDCQLSLLSADELELRVSVMLMSKSETLRRVR